MVANGNASTDVEASEQTGLLDSSGVSPDTRASETGSESEPLWEELDRPWPASFERSISLLASPVIKVEDAALFTKSPKAGNTPLAARRRMRYETPDGTLLPPLMRHKSIDEKFRKGAPELPSMDFKTTKDSLREQATLIPLADTQKKQELKAKEAAEYRANLLKQKKKERFDGVEMSPAYRREKAYLLRSEQQKADDREREASIDGKATFAQCAFNLANILMGVGLLGLPYACAKAGMLGGIFAILTLGFICWKTSIMIGRELNGDPRPAAYFDDSPWKSPLMPGSVPEARMRKPISSFPDIAREAFGEAGCILLSSVLYFELFSCICIFIVSIGDHLHTLFPTIPTTFLMIGTTAVSLVPIILLRTAKLLSYLSMVGTFATAAVVGAVVLSFAFEGNITKRVADKMANPPPGPYYDLWDTNGLALAFGLVAYCFSGHAIIPSIYSSMQKPQEFEMVVNLSFLAVLAACLAVGLSGYFMFGSLVFDQVTISLEVNSSATLAMTILTYLMVLTAFSKLTLTMFPLAIGMEEIVAPYLSSDKAMTFTSTMIKMLLLVLALVVAIYVPSFSLLCSMVGMICTMAVSVVFPAAAYLKLFGPTLTIWEKVMCWAFVIGGCAMAVVGTIFGL